MSQERTYTIGCPGCNNEQEVSLYESINVDQSPQLREDLLQNQLNIVTCPICEAAFRVDKPLLYNDPDRQFMIYWIPSAPDSMEDGQRQFRESLGQLTSAMPEGVELPAVHLVFTRPELIELIFLLEAELDDRIIEYIKYTIYAKNPAKLDPERKLLLFDAEDSSADTLCFVVQDIESKQFEGMLQYSREAYDALCEMFDEDDQTANLMALFPGPHVNARHVILKDG